jgi:hypothetical protein
MQLQHGAGGGVSWKEVLRELSRTFLSPTKRIRNLG